jgi:hypothetical protein
MSTEERAMEAVEHLQHAALEMIAAARAVLDVAEELVRDPAPLLQMAQAAAQMGAHVAAANGATPDGEPRVQHIRVS